VAAKVGCYHFGLDGKTIIHHASNTKVEFSAKEGNWQIRKNYTAREAQLHNIKTMSSQPVYKIFETACLGVPVDQPFDWIDILDVMQDDIPDLDVPGDGENTGRTTNSKAKARPPPSDKPGRPPRACTFMAAATTTDEDAAEAPFFPLSSRFGIFSCVHVCVHARK